MRIGQKEFPFNIHGVGKVNHSCKRVEQNRLHGAGWDREGFGNVSNEFLKQWGDTTCLFGPIFAKAKPLGVIIADRGVTNTPITDHDYSIFMMVLAQINMNLTRLATAHPSN